MAVCLLRIENYPTETHRGRVARDDRLRLKPGGARICCSRESRDKEVVAVMLAWAIISLRSLILC